MMAPLLDPVAELPGLLLIRSSRYGRIRNVILNNSAWDSASADSQSARTWSGWLVRLARDGVSRGERRRPCLLALICQPHRRRPVPPDRA